VKYFSGVSLIFYYLSPSTSMLIIVIRKQKKTSYIIFYYNIVHSSNVEKYDEFFYLCRRFYANKCVDVVLSSNVIDIHTIYVRCVDASCHEVFITNYTKIEISFKTCLHKYSYSYIITSMKRFSTSILDAKVYRCSSEFLVTFIVTKNSC